MGRSQAAYDSPHQNLAQSPRGRSSDAAKHDTVVFSFLPFFLELAAAAFLLADMKRSRRRSFGLQLRLPLQFLFSIIQRVCRIFLCSFETLCFSFLSVSLLSVSPPTLPCPLPFTVDPRHFLLLFFGSYTLISLHLFLYMHSLLSSLHLLLHSFLFPRFISFPMSPPAAAGSLAEYF
ncbi:hypothetical protein ABVT39_027536 [Epinephelus coioides]